MEKRESASVLDKQAERLNPASVPDAPARPSTSRAAPVSYRADIDGLRAVAVAAVVVFHAFPTRLTGGFIGVDVFFVISGYLITSIIVGSCLAGKFSITEFYSRRVRRIFPALILVLATTLALGWPILTNSEYARLGSQVVAGSGFIANLLFWSQAGYFDQTAIEKPLLHLWSLGVEEQFYIVWPLLVWAMWRLRRHFAVTLVLVGALSFALSLYETSASPSAAFYSPLTRFWELLVGGFLACKEKGLVSWTGDALRSSKAPQVIWRTWAIPQDVQALIGAALVLLPMVIMTGESKFPGWWAGAPVVGTFLLLHTGPKAWIGRKLLSHPAMVTLGLISFPLYLWHWPLLSFAHMLYPTQPPKWVTRGVVATSVVLGWLTYVLLERPLRRWSTARNRVVALSLAMVVIVVVGAATWISGGMPGRFPGVVDELAGYTYDYRKDYREGECFLRSDQIASAFGKCVEEPSGETEHLVLLWGDSHAAHLYPGLRASLGTKYRIAELTSPGCPPFVDHDIGNRKGCRDTNDYILKWAAKNKPELILLSADWMFYDPKFLTPTVEALRRTLNAPRIIVVGPVPEWSGGLPRILLTYARRSSLKTTVPERLSLGPASGSYKAEAAFREQSKVLKVEYVSILNILCDDDRKCLTRTGPGVDSLTAWDEAHLTNIGSKYVGARLAAYMTATGIHASPR